MIEYEFRRDKLRKMGNKRLDHWFTVFQNVIKKIQFAPIYALYQREEVEQEKIRLAVDNINSLIEHDDDQWYTKNFITDLL